MFSVTRKYYKQHNFIKYITFYTYVIQAMETVASYGPSLRVQKIECRNHLLRNYSKKMMALSKRTLSNRNQKKNTEQHYTAKN